MQDPDQITFFAKTDARGQEVPFGIKAQDRTKHVYVIGKTGMGKSTLLENMAVQDIQNGNGIAFIDPHGATADTLLNYIPEDRVDDVLYFAPFDTNHPIAFNVMEDVGPDKRHLVVSGLMSVFKKIWVDAWSARMEYILSNTLLALLEYPDSTLLGVNRMLSDKHYRKSVINNITDPAVKSFWVDEFLNYNERYMQEAGDAIKNKIGQFTSNPLIRNIVGQSKSSFDLREIMDGRKILIANLSKGLVGESNANLLGSMLTTRIYLAAMSRADLSSEHIKKAPNFYFYVDEFQSFANATFADILSEARKYKLNLTIAHQYIEQMEEEVRNAVFGNVGTIISFRVGPFDAEILETIYTPKFLAADIVNLGFAQIYLTLMIDGIGSQPFSALTLPPIEAQRVTYKDVVIAHSRKRFAHERKEVEEGIYAWHEQIFDEKKLAYEAEKAKKIENGELPPTAAGKHTPLPPELKGSTDSRPQSAAGAPKQAAPKAYRNRGDRPERRDTAERKDRPDRPERTDRNDRKERSDRSDKRDSRPPKKDDKPKPPKEKSVHELRDILKNIAGHDSDQSKDTKGGSNQDHGKSAAEKSKEERSRDNQQYSKAALQQAVSAAVEQRQSPSQTSGTPKKQVGDRKSSLHTGNGQPQAKAGQQRGGQTDTRKNHPSQAPERTHSQAQAQAQSQPQPTPRAETKDPLDRATLERLMKTTAADQHPLH